MFKNSSWNICLQEQTVPSGIPTRRLGPRWLLPWMGYRLRTAMRKEKKYLRNTGTPWQLHSSKNEYIILRISISVNSRKSKQSIPNASKAFWKDHRHLAQQWKYLTGADPVYTTVEENYKAQFGMYTLEEYDCQSKVFVFSKYREVPEESGHFCRIPGEHGHHWGDLPGGAQCVHNLEGHQPPGIIACLTLCSISWALF